MTEPDLFAEIPTERASWELLYPRIQSRYLAWCNAERITPHERLGHEYMAWINRKVAEFRALRGMAREEPLGARQDEFTDWLWGRG